MNERALEVYKERSERFWKDAQRAEAMLRRVYAEHGPRAVMGQRALSAAKFAKMTKREVDDKYDFPDRHLMHAVARVLARTTGDYP